MKSIKINNYDSICTRGFEPGYINQEVEEEG